MISRTELQRVLDGLLKPADIKDYCPNGLQVEGKDRIKRIVTGVTASQRLIDAAVEHDADAIIVHHGYFWKGEADAITGMKKRRIKTLLENDINLFAYHLPIDVHTTLGNNAQLGKLLNFENARPHADISPQGIVFEARLGTPVSQQELADNIETILGKAPLVEGDPDQPISTVAWCTGGGQGFIDNVAQAGIDAFISGEVSEQTIHSAREQGVHFFACGHHATERYGVKALGEFLQEKFGLATTFIDIDNPA